VHRNKNIFGVIGENHQKVINRVCMKLHVGDEQSNWSHMIFTKVSLASQFGYILSLAHHRTSSIFF
jgi:hypothetical protein